MTQRELDTIDERADKEIFELLCCAMTKCFVNGDRPTGRLARKHHEARKRFERSLPRGTRYVVDCEVEQDGSGHPKPGGYITCRIVTMDEESFRRMMARRMGAEPEDDDEDEDDDDDEFDDYT